MKRIQKKIPVFYLLIIIFVSSCHKGADTPVVIDPVTNVNPVPVQGSLQGKVVDQNGVAVVGATVKSGSNTTTTDSRGLFIFHTIQLDKYASVVTVQKAGYFQALRTFTSKQNGANYVRLKLIPKQLAGTISATSGGTVTLFNNSSINIPANSVVTKSGNQPYSGTISVYAAYIDPSNPDIAQKIPGSFQALDSQNKRVVLKSYGMMVVELETAAGEALQIAAGKKANLHAAIPASLQASSPATIPLWSMNEVTGLWKQEGNAVKTGNYYDGDVSHFSFWNWDFPGEPVFVEMTIKSPAGPLPNAPVKVTSITSGFYVYGVTDSAGNIAGFLPKNQPLLLEILNNCDQPVYSQNIGPFSQNTNLGTLTITASLQLNLQISGNVADCNNQPLAQGAVAIYFEGQLYNTPVINGLFSLLITRCPTTPSLEIVTIDNAGAQQSNPYIFPVNSNTVNTGTLNACGVSTISTMTYTVDGLAYDLSSALGDSLIAYTGLSWNGNGTGFKGVGGTKAGQPAIHLNFEYDGGYTTGTFGMVNFLVNNISITSHINPFTVNITAWRNVGQFIDGNFNVQTVSGSTTHRITATFRIKRFD